ncbi:hypothetical protein PPSIR1_26678 [Plesiocystis pacifica SIR-1]|uniref:Lipoprotein n=1 Tax=Plesiocystis pacifica SIR-1 TaxID=391625 RepID=A6GAA1_9BACT|nr:hypothetical protein [Plesiocystis pacifica]EDM77203.1 hypothetical protein PPSIR1_26678 [Plesiocystis pacifica SIR-1]
MSRRVRSFLVSSIALASPLLTAGCNAGVKPVELEGSFEAENQLQLAVNKDVDILLVIDNSGSMAAEQANLAANFGAMIDILEEPAVKANYRIGVTTTDNGNPWCPPGQTTPEGGKFVASSCRERLGDFVFEGAGDPVDAQVQACLEICDHESIELLPTFSFVDDAELPRPWLERIEGQSNVGGGLGTAEAFACLAPQGINGCGFESPLESMYLALARAQNPGEDNYGFLRDSAILAVITISDEADCSYDKDWASIFEAEGSKTFWEDPDEPFPTSALCWNAGVDCAGDPSSYDECVAVNYAEDGSPTGNPDDAVLLPVSRFVDQLAGIENAKRALNPDQDVIVTLIGGVDENGEVVYADALDPEQQANFGIGPGCEGASGEFAVPPVRQREVVEAFGGEMFSICGADYTGPLETIADRIRDQIQPACYGRCVADTEPEVPFIQPSCEVEEELADGTVNAIVECEREGEWGPYANDPEIGGYRLPEGAKVCYALLTDADESSEDPLDDMSEECVELNFNMEFEITRRPGFPAAGGTSVSANCVTVDEPEAVCPGIGAA